MGCAIYIIWEDEFDIKLFMYFHSAKKLLRELVRNRLHGCHFHKLRSTNPWSQIMRELLTWWSHVQWLRWIMVSSGNHVQAGKILSAIVSFSTSMYIMRWKGFLPRSWSISSLMEEHYATHSPGLSFMEISGLFNQQSVKVKLFSRSLVHLAQAKERPNKVLRALSYSC